MTHGRSDHKTVRPPPDMNPVMFRMCLYEASHKLQSESDNSRVHPSKCKSLNYKENFIIQRLGDTHLIRNADFNRTTIFILA